MTSLHIMIDHDSEWPDNIVLAWTRSEAHAVRLDAYPTTTAAIADALRRAEEAAT